LRVALLLAIAFVALVALLHRDARIDPRPVITHPRWLLALPVAAAGVTLMAQRPILFLLSCAMLGIAVALLLDSFRLTAEGIEVRGAVLAWRTLRVKETRWFLDVRTTRGQHVRLPRWMDGLRTLSRLSGGPPGSG
jgi:hypothetical protein